VALPGEEQHVRVEKTLTLQPGMVFSDEPGIYIKASSACVSRRHAHHRKRRRAVFTPQSPSIEIRSVRKTVD